MELIELWTPLSIRNLHLGNRLVMPPMALDNATATGEVTPELLGHYMARARAKGANNDSHSGIGLIIVEHCYVNPAGKAHPRQLGIYDDTLIAGLKRVADGIHAAGAAAGIEISHAGMRGLNRLLGPSAIQTPLSRHAVADPNTGKQNVSAVAPEELDLNGIGNIVEDFARAAVRAKQAGFDLVDIHCAHGYLLNQFLSPLTNHRRDAYGGGLHNRLRLSLEVLSAIRQAVGEDYPVFIRLGVDDRIEGGYTVEEGTRAAAMLAQTGVDCLDLSGGLGGYIRSGPEGFFVYMADAVKKATSVPVLVTGGIKTAHYANKIVNEEHADLVGIGRAILADPNWAARAWLETHG